MVMDFSFLKEEMMANIDRWYDHGLALGCDDPLVERLTGKVPAKTYLTQLGVGPCGKYVLLPCTPTVENLARVWFEVMESAVVNRTSGRAKLTRMRVYETPNCWADYPSIAGA